ncbi:MAG: ComF family protein [Candidatus Methylomirabilia bacterium]
MTLYGDTVREALHALKFGRKTALARPLGDLLAQAGQALLPPVSVDGLVPVPLHPTREAERGFNQSLLLARRVARQWRLPVIASALKRVVATRPQTEFSIRERRANVRGAFGLRGPAAVAGRHLLLIDDVFTTGATATECCRVLLDGGASAVGVLTVARVS